MREDWLIVAISGVTNAGKTTITKKLLSSVPNSVGIFQDEYFRSIDDKKHVYLEDLRHNNWDILTAVDTDKLWDCIGEILERPRLDPARKNLLLLDGFLILNFEKTVELCDLKYYLRLTKEECWVRRQQRNYDPPDVPGYFDQVVWPEHLTSFQEMLGMNKCVVLMDGRCSMDSNYERILQDINCRL